MKPKRNPNCTEVANDCMIYFLVHELKFIIDDRHDLSPALAPLAEAMERVVMHDIPADVMARIERTHFLKRMQHQFADNGLCPFNVYKHLTEDF